MKTILTVISLLVFATILYASVILPPYDKSKPPSLSLPVAYDHALSVIGAKTNELHCTSAELTTYFSSDGEWYFTFCSTNANARPKHIAVKFNGEAFLDNGLR